MSILRLVLLVVALVLFLIAGFGVPAGRVNLLALGLAALAGSMLVP